MLVHVTLAVIGVYGPLEPLTYVLAAVTFLGVAMTAVLIPARRGSNVQPINALRSE
jgi:ABC-type lipoprotein release transport system permease subunit